MRVLVGVVALALAACGQDAPSETPAAESIAPFDPGPAPVVEPERIRLDTATVVGAWSFDRTCASGDAMGLMPDGKAYFDEWGEGTWSIDADGKLVLDLRELTPGVEDAGPGEQLVMTLTPQAPAGEDLVGLLSSPREDIPARDINAKRCPES